MSEEGPPAPVEPRYSTTCETGVLSFLMARPDKRSTALSEDAFFLPANRILYREIMAADGEIDPSLFAVELGERGLLDLVGGPGAVGALIHTPKESFFDQYLAKIREDHFARESHALGLRISEAAYDRADPQRFRAELAKADELLKAAATPGKLTLLERAYALRFDPETEPPPDEVCLAIGGIPIAARGNLTVIQGKSKVGKSAVVSAILGAVYRANFTASGDTLCMSWIGTDGGAIIHLDTEQSRADWHGLVSRGILRSGLPAGDARLVSLPLVMFARSERLTILRQALEFERTRLGAIDLVVIDGIADLCTSPNDEAESLELVSQVMALAQEFNTAVGCVLHENPGTESAKTRGHLGSELNRKAFANLRIDKDAETSVSTIHGTEMRKRDIPKEQGFCFAWDDAAGMHTFQGRAEGLRAAQKEAAAFAKESAYFREIFDASGTNWACPAFTPDEAIQAHRDNGGTSSVPSRAAIKKRMQRAEALGVLRKASATTWALKPSVTSGT